MNTYAVVVYVKRSRFVETLRMRTHMHMHMQGNLGCGSGRSRHQGDLCIMGIRY